MKWREFISNGFESMLSLWAHVEDEGIDAKQLSLLEKISIAVIPCMMAAVFVYAVYLFFGDEKFRSFIAVLMCIGFFEYFIKRRFKQK
jgi:hypothetical protein